MDNYSFKRLAARFMALTLTAVTVFSVVPQQNTVHAETAAQLQQKADAIAAEKSAIQSEIDALGSDLVSVLSSIDTLQIQIADNQQELEETQAELAAAQEAQQKQYEEMKLRVKYLYEENSGNVLTSLLESGSIAELINKIEYSNEVYEYDQEQQASYVALTQEIQAMEQQLEDTKASLAAQNSELEAQQNNLNALIAAKGSDLEAVSAELEAAQELATKQANIEEQARIAAQQAALEAATKAAADEAARQSASNSNASRSNNNTNQTASSGGSTGGNSNSNTGGGSTGGSSGISTSGGDGTRLACSGYDIVAYANQFVGCPYVWGGNSLTNGCDCSHFVWLVLKHFGYSGGYLTSNYWVNVGRPVAASDMQPGDIVVYDGHVAFYAGNGCLVEAQSSSKGITNNRQWTSSRRTVLGIRRVV